ncbi:MAG: Xaa-Pro peptidase family protein [Thermodesulfobacteriota bacterium]|nr:Xaa-Pro peptidase family protein [Thermodesulfobacteriota bacterium]
MTSPLNNRIEKLRDRMKDSDMDTLLVLSDENRRYLSGFTGEDGSCAETAGALLITENRLVLATDPRYELQAKTEAPLYDIVCYRSGLAGQIGKILCDLQTSRLGFEAGRITYAQFQRLKGKTGPLAPDVEIKNADDLLNGIRMCKDAGELAIMKQSLALAEDVFEDFLARDLSLGVTEKQAAWMLEKRMREAGADALSFPVIAAFGENSALPHAVPGDRPLREGEPVLFDWGAKVDGYCSDISRSFVPGRADDRYKHAHKTVWTARQRAIEAVRPGINARDVDAAARQYIDDSEFKGMFGHGVGHGVGLAIHEPPSVSTMSEAVLETGMVFTIEPGIYLPGWGGIRLEEMVMVSPDGAVVLNRLDAANPEMPEWGI